MPALNQNADTVISRYSGVDVNTLTKTILYTVPQGKKLIVTKVVFYNASTNLTTAKWGIGYDSASTDVIAGETFVELTSDALVTQRQVKDGFALGNAADTIGLKCSIAQGGAATIDVDVFGYLLDA